MCHYNDMIRSGRNLMLCGSHITSSRADLAVPSPSNRYLSSSSLIISGLFISLIVYAFLLWHWNNYFMYAL